MTRKLFVARLTGTQEQMGAQHGALVADDAVRLHEFYRTMPERALAGEMPKVGKLAVRALANAWQSRLARDRPAELAARTRAFVAAVKQRMPAHDARGAFLTLATMDSMQNCVSLAARAQLGPFARPLRAVLASAVPACSTLIAWGQATEDGELLFGRNFDFPGVGVWDAAPAFLVCAPDRGQRYGFFTTKGADTPVVTIVNEAGIVAAPHTRWHRGVTWGGAMIVDLVHDIARRAETLADAIAIARERGASSSWGIAVGSAREKSACVLELAGANVDVVRPHGDYLTCTNRYRTSTLQAGEIAGSAAWSIHADRREARLRQLADARTRPLAARDIARFLGDRRDIAAPARERHVGAILAQPLNVHCVVAKPLAREAWLGIDRAPVCEGQWAHVAWAWDEEQFTVEDLPEFVAPQDAATRHVGDAMRAYEGSHDTAAAQRSIDLAIAACPDDPSLRLCAVWLALEARQPPRALEHVRAGLATETEPYRRGQLLLWGARAAEPTEPVLARRWRDELAQLSGAGLDELRAAARKKHDGRPRANLMMVDAY